MRSRRGGCILGRAPDAFFSYTRFDDQNDNGAISKFRVRLADAVCAVTGQMFEIFQDVEGIGLGEHWRGKLHRMLDQTRFFIPILTPSYFKSAACRDELEKFLRAEAKRERNDLVLPIHWIECEDLEADLLASRLRERHWQDWRTLRHSSFRTKGVRTALETLAREIERARRRGPIEVARVSAPIQSRQPSGAPSLKPVIPASNLPAILTWSQALHWLVVGRLENGDPGFGLDLAEALSQRAGEPAAVRRLPSSTRDASL